MKTALGKINSKLARRFSIYVILTSTIITIFTSALQIYNEYQSEISEVDVLLAQIQATQVPAIAARVWEIDTQELQTTLDNLQSLAEINYLAVYEKQKLLASSGLQTSDNTYQKFFTLEFKPPGRPTVLLGEMTVEITLSRIYSQLYEQAALIIASNALKTFIVAGFILLIFYRLVGRHLIDIAEYAKQLELSTLTDKLTLQRDNDANSQKGDELDVLNSALNTMQSNLDVAAKQLRLNEKDLAITLQSIGDAVITTDKTGKISRMNPVAEQMTAWQASEARGRYLHEVLNIIDTQSRESLESPVDAVIKSGETIKLSNHTTLISRTYDEFQISDTAAPIRDEQGDIVGIVLVFSDITEQYQLREMAAQSRRDMEAILDNTPAVVYVKKTNGEYSYVNKRFCDLFHTSLEEVVGKTDYDLFPDDFADNFRQNDNDVIAVGHPLESEEHAMVDDERRTYVSVKFPLMGDSKEIVAICGISTDITERKKMEREHRRTQKMDALGKLTGGIAHDYNNMLGIILGYAELIDMENNGNDELKNYTTEIIRAGKRGVKMTKRLLSFSRQQATEAKELHLNALIHDEEHMLAKTLTSRITLSLDLQQELWTVWLDHAEFEDALINMCINAMHAISGTGEIQIQTRNEHIASIDAKTLGIHEGDYVLLSITDSGCGISDEVKEKIFDPYFSTKGEQGTGLGLSMVYGFMERSKGTIQIFSEPGHGARFCLYFPRYERNNQQTEYETPSVHSSKQHGNESILVVDDEKALLILCKEILTMHGYNVFTSRSPTEALTILQDQHIDLLISDVVMPEVDGYELASTVVKTHPDTKILLASGYADIDNAFLVDKALKDNILQKPYHSDTLLKKVRQLLDS